MLFTSKSLISQPMIVTVLRDFFHFDSIPYLAGQQSEQIIFLPLLSTVAYVVSLRPISNFDISVIDNKNMCIDAHDRIIRGYALFLPGQFHVGDNDHQLP